jgi:predicted enzyme related to lactoylglutathione lyase
MESANVSAVLFAKDLRRVADFYVGALDMVCGASDEHHSVLRCCGFELMVHQIPKHIADVIDLQQPPQRRSDAAIRLNFPVHDVETARRLAKTFGGQIDDVPPQWADPKALMFLGFDPEGNVFKVSQHAL